MSLTDFLSCLTCTALVEQLYFVLQTSGEVQIPQGLNYICIAEIIRLLLVLYLQAQHRQSCHRLFFISTSGGGCKGQGQTL